MLWQPLNSLPRLMAFNAGAAPGRMRSLGPGLAGIASMGDRLRHLALVGVLPCVWKRSHRRPGTAAQPAGECAAIVITIWHVQPAYDAACMHG